MIHPKRDEVRLYEAPPALTILPFTFLSGLGIKLGGLISHTIWVAQRAPSSFPQSWSLSSWWETDIAHITGLSLQPLSTLNRPSHGNGLYSTIPAHAPSTSVPLIWSNTFPSAPKRRRSPPPGSVTTIGCHPNFCGSLNGSAAKARI